MSWNARTTNTIRRKQPSIMGKNKVMRTMVLLVSRAIAPCAPRANIRARLEALGKLPELECRSLQDKQLDE